MTLPRPRGTRLDQYIVDHGLADNLHKAMALIMTGRVLIEGKRTTTPSQTVLVDADITLEPRPKYVSRGGTKLAHALDYFTINLEGLTALDIGASTGGFTHCLLQAGAKKVYALDVGHGQLDYKLRQDPRVVVIERTNARYPFQLGDLVNLVTVDVSFISITKVLPSIAVHLQDYGTIIALVKPQFEAYRGEVGIGGVIKDPRVHARVLGRVIAWAVDNGFRLMDIVPSPIKGSEGNREFFLLLCPRERDQA